MIPLNVISRHGVSMPFDQSILRRTMCLRYVFDEYGYATMPPKFILSEADMVRIDGLLAFVMIRLVLQSSETVHALSIRDVVDRVMMMMDANADFRGVLMYREREPVEEDIEAGGCGMAVAMNAETFDPYDEMDVIPGAVSQVQLPNDES